MNKLLLGVCILIQISACRPQQTEPHNLGEEIVSNWGLSALEGTLWTLEAKKAIQQDQIRKLGHLDFQSEGWQIQSPKARQNDLEQVIFQLENITAQNMDLNVYAKTATLDLENKELTGQKVNIRNQYWTMSAQGFKSVLPFKKWSLNQIEAQFEIEP